ncbi:hypothetical protein ABZ814_13640 [Micromonospora musae]|uniref:hypothetical protein n=1 Tax=Micromonospora musae TaxID=1894970 RepID=UPI0033C0E46D
MTDTAFPTPADARAVVDYALLHGWQPEEPGGAFILSEDEHATDFELPELLLTDRLRTPESGDPTTRVIRADESGATA